MTIRVDGFKQLWQDINLLEHDSVLYPEEAPFLRVQNLCSSFGCIAKI